jgi:TonB family protein
MSRKKVGRLSSVQSSRKRFFIIPLILTVLIGSVHGQSDKSTSSKKGTPGGLEKPEPIKKVKPTYPPLAKASRIQGTVTFTALIDKEGKVQQLTLASGHPMLVKAAEDAARQWVYAPKIVNGEPVPMRIALDVEFTP